MKSFLPGIGTDRVMDSGRCRRQPRRAAVLIANTLRGKMKPTFTPAVDIGDFVIVINADKVKLTGSKENKKIYERYSGYRGGRRTFTAAAVRERHPERLIEQAVKGMLPGNHLCRRMMTRLKIYAGPEHPHQAQQPRTVELG